MDGQLEISWRRIISWSTASCFISCSSFAPAHFILQASLDHKTFIPLQCKYGLLLSNYFDNNFIQVYNTLMEAGKRPTSSLEIVTFMFVSNFIGIICARSLHYQFYVWYYHQLPLLVHCCGINLLISIPLLLGIEYCWNIYPSTVTSSSLLVLIHIFILFKLYTRKSTSKPKVQ